MYLEKNNQKFDHLKIRISTRNLIYLVYIIPLIIVVSMTIFN